MTDSLVLARDAAREHVLEVATELLERGGAPALSTRSVAAAAGIRAASLYELFGDKDGLLAALAALAFRRYLADKHTVPTTGDPVEDMRRGWDAHVEFGLAHPAFYLLMFGSDRPGRRPPVAAEAHDQLLAYLDRVARAGRLRVPPALAARLLQAAVTGVTLSLIADGTEQLDLDVSVRLREAVIESLVTVSPAVGDEGLAAQALALDSALAVDGSAGSILRGTETALLRDWLDRLARGGRPSQTG